MNRDEQKAITDFIRGVAARHDSAMDVEADAIIRALFVRNPDLAYRMTNLAMAQARELQSLHAVRAGSKPVKPTRRSWLAQVMNRNRECRARLDPVLSAKQRF